MNENSILANFDNGGEGKDDNNSSSDYSNNNDDNNDSNDDDGDKGDGDNSDDGNNTSNNNDDNNNDSNGSNDRKIGMAMTATAATMPATATIMTTTTTSTTATTAEAMTMQIFPSEKFSHRNAERIQKKLENPFDLIFGQLIFFRSESQKKFLRRVLPKNWFLSRNTFPAKKKLFLCTNRGQFCENFTILYFHAIKSFYLRIQSALTCACICKKTMDTFNLFLLEN